jgi:hypothetical protein
VDCSEALVQEMLSELVRDFALKDGNIHLFFLQKKEAHNGSKRAMLLSWASRGFVEMLDSDRQAWRLTDAGMRSLKVGNTFKFVTNFMKPRPAIQTEQASTFELMSLMMDDRWICKTFWKQKGVKNPDPFMAGHEKAFWVKPGQQGLSPMYLRALIHVADKKTGDAVLHFATNQYYSCILQGGLCILICRSRCIAQKGLPTCEAHA